MYVGFIGRKSITVSCGKRSTSFSRISNAIKNEKQHISATKSTSNSSIELNNQDSIQQTKFPQIDLEQAEMIRMHEIFQKQEKMPFQQNKKQQPLSRQRVQIQQEEIRNLKTLVDSKMEDAQLFFDKLQSKQPIHYLILMKGYMRTKNYESK